MWHGASWTFIGWGLYHGFFSIIERLGLGKVLKRFRVLPHIYTMLVVMIGWVFFRAESMTQSLAIVGRMFTPWLDTTSDVILGTQVGVEAVLAMICGILGCGLVQAVFSKGRMAVLAKRWTGSVPEFIWCALVLAASILMLANNTYNPFIYFRF